MPFQRGPAPIRRTLQYLKKGPLVFKERVQVMTVNYNEEHRNLPKYTKLDQHLGTREFVFWNLQQVQYKNPGVQIATFKNLTPSPFITCYLDGGEKVLFDVDGQTNDEILERLVSTLGKTKTTLDAEALASEKKDNPANFGRKCERYCICSQPGQLPCPALVPVPKFWRGKYYYHGHQDEEEDS